MPSTHVKTEALVRKEDPVVFVVLALLEIFVRVRESSSKIRFEGPGKILPTPYIKRIFLGTYSIRKLANKGDGLCLSCFWRILPTKSKVISRYSSRTHSGVYRYCIFRSNCILPCKFRFEIPHELHLELFINVFFARIIVSYSSYTALGKIHNLVITFLLVNAFHKLIPRCEFITIGPCYGLQ